MSQEITTCPVCDRRFEMPKSKAKLKSDARKGLILNAFLVLLLPIGVWLIVLWMQSGFSLGSLLTGGGFSLLLGFLGLRNVLLSVRALNDQTYSTEIECDICGNKWDPYAATV